MRWLCAVVVLSCVLVGGVYAQSLDEGRLQVDSIAVIPFVNDSGDPRWDSLASSMASTIRLSLALSGQFDYRGVDPFDPFSEQGAVQLARLAREERIDAIVIGRIVRESSGRLLLTSSVYGNTQGRIIGEESREAFDDLDVIDAADELVLVSTSAILGFRVDFGAILLRPDRADIPYRVYLDGNPIGETIAAIPQVLVGRRRIEISVETRRGEQFVYSTDRLVRPGEALEVSFSVPNIATGSVDEISMLHEIAASLLGQYSDIQIARDALRESAVMIPEDGAGAVQDRYLEQKTLELAWDLEEEFLALDPARYADGGDYLPGSPFHFVARSRDFLSSQEPTARDPRVRERVQRNGAAHLLLLQLRWAQLLSQGRWDEAQALLDDMERVEDDFSLSRFVRVSQLRRSFDTAIATSETYDERRSRPWPYLTGGIGIGLASYGGYLLATDAVGNKINDAEDIHALYGAETDPAEVVRLREEANDAYDEAELFEALQWSSIAVGGVVAIVSAIRVFQNRRAGDVYLRDWARERYGRLMTVAAQAFPGDERTRVTGFRVLVLGPYEETVGLDDRVDLLPFVSEAAIGERFSTSRSAVVTEDASRLMDGSSRLVVLR